MLSSLQRLRLNRLYNFHPSDMFRFNKTNRLCRWTHSGPEPSYTKAFGYKQFVSETPFKTTWKQELPSITLAYETWGTLNKDKENVVLLQAGLSASSHAKSTVECHDRGWWEDFIGPGKALDTNLFYIICCNNLGGCFGSTGPSSINPKTNQRYGLQFPFISIHDIVKSQFLLLDHLKIPSLHAVVGGSLGGMQSLCSSTLYPDKIKRLVSLSASAMAHPSSIALRYAQRRALMADPNFANGNYYGGPYPESGMRIAREIATFGYRSGPEWEARFGRWRQKPKLSDLPDLFPIKSRNESQYIPVHKQLPTLKPEFEIETYLDYQGQKWCKIYDPNSMIYLSKAMDLFSLETIDANGIPSLATGLSNVKMPTLVIGAKSDILFPLWQQRQIANALKNAGNKYVVYYELDTLYGHDTFLLDVNSIGAAVKGHLEQVF